MRKHTKPKCHFVSVNIHEHIKYFVNSYADHLLIKIIIQHYVTNKLLFAVF